MPYTRKRKRPRRRTFKSRPYKRRRITRYRRRKLIPRAPSGMHVNRPVKMRYCFQGYITSTTGILETIVFSANNLFDPEVAAGGHQPMGFDQMALLYQRYLVLGSKISINVADNASTHQTPCMVGCLLTDDAAVAPYVTNTGYIEAKRGTWRAITGGSHKTTRMSYKYSPKKFWGIKDIKDNRLKIGSSVGSSPEEQAYFMLWCQSLDGGTQSVAITVVIDYIVQFTEAKELPQS